MSVFIIIVAVCQVSFNSPLSCTTKSDNQVFLSKETCKVGLESLKKKEGFKEAKCVKVTASTK